MYIQERNTQLHNAARNGWFPIVKELSEKGADINCRNEVIIYVCLHVLVYLSPYVLYIHVDTACVYMYNVCYVSYVYTFIPH